MLSRVALVFLIIVHFGCASSRTEVYKANEKSQAIFTIGNSLLNDTPKTLVKLEIKGQVAITPTCGATDQYLVELFKVGSTTPFSNAPVNANLQFIFDINLPFTGEIELRLLQRNTSKVLSQKRFYVDEKQDRLSVVLEGCTN